MKLTLAIFLFTIMLAPLAMGQERSSNDEFVDWLKEQSQEKDSATPTWKPLFGLRLRQEYLQNVFYFDENNDSRNWLRLRTRLGLQWNRGNHRVEVRAANEFRDIYEPDIRWIPLDEVILDRAAWTWGTDPEGPYTLIIGRQDIIWDDGFLMLEGHPLDGSRSIYHNAVRMQFRDNRGEFEVLGITGQQVDDYVLAGDENTERLLSDNDETAVAFRYKHNSGKAMSLIWKKESLVERPYWDWCNVTFGLRLPWRTWIAEGAIQRNSSAEWAYAFQFRGSANLYAGGRGEVGYFHYSGESENSAAFKTPYGRWPKWSELYLYTLIGEAGPAAWQNIAGAHLHMHQEISDELGLRFSAYYLSALEPEWTSRGILLQSEIKYEYNSWISTHFLWEYLQPNEDFATAPENAHFLRWEINFDYK
jgi:hypothetical protein